MKDNLMAWLGGILILVILVALDSLLGPLLTLLCIFIFGAVAFLIDLIKMSKSKEEFYENLRYFPGYMARKIYNSIKEAVTILPEKLFSIALRFCLYAICLFFYLVTWKTESLINNSSVDAFTKLLLLNYKTHLQFFLGIVFLVLFGISIVIDKLNEILKKSD